METSSRAVPKAVDAAEGPHSVDQFNRGRGTDPFFGAALLTD
jgi:hypothetical protein